MANSYWNYVTTLVPNTLADANVVNTSFTGIESGFALIETEFTNRKKVYYAPTQACSSKTAVTFLTLPSWTEEINVIIGQTSLIAGALTQHVIQLGTSSGVEATSYDTSIVDSVDAAATSGDRSIVAGFPIASSSNSLTLVQGQVKIMRITGNEWISSSQMTNYTAGAITSHNATGNKTLAGTLDRLVFTNLNSLLMDAGNIKVICEG